MRRRTTLLVDEKLLEEARKICKAKSKRETVELGLAELIRARRREQLRKELGTYSLALSLKELRRLRRHG